VKIHITFHVHTRYQIRLDLSNVKGNLHKDRIPPSAFFRLLPRFAIFCLLPPCAVAFLFLLAPPFFLLSSTLCRHLLSVTSCLNAAFCRLLLSAFFRLGSYAAFCLLPHLAFRKPQPPVAAFSRILLYAAICSFLPSETFCLLLFSAFCFS
jgi:hypothetical protein